MAWGPIWAQGPHDRAIWAQGPYGHVYLVPSVGKQPYRGTTEWFWIWGPKGPKGPFVPKGSLGPKGPKGPRAQRAQGPKGALGPKRVQNIKVPPRKTMQNAPVNIPNGAICCKSLPKPFLRGSSKSPVCGVAKHGSKPFGARLQEHSQVVQVG